MHGVVKESHLHVLGAREQSANPAMECQKQGISYRESMHYWDGWVLPALLQYHKTCFRPFVCQHWACCHPHAVHTRGVQVLSVPGTLLGTAQVQFPGWRS